jgi:hypothetical protein
MNAPVMNSHAIACVAAVGENDPALVGAVVRAMEDSMEALVRIRSGDLDGPDFGDLDDALREARANLAHAIRMRYEAKAKEASNGEA